MIGESPERTRLKPVDLKFEELLQLVQGSEFRSSDGVAGQAVSPSRISVSRIDGLKESGLDSVSFFFSRDYEKDLQTADPGFLVTGLPFAQALEAAGWLRSHPKTRVAVSKDPYLALARVTQWFAAAMELESRPAITDVHPSAQVHPLAKLDPGVSVGPGVVIEKGVWLQSGVTVGANVFVGSDCVVGEQTVLFSGVTLYASTEIGKRCRIHANAVIGADGFGYAPVVENGAIVRHEKIVHFGKVIIEDDAEIGALSCVDRATFGVTRIGAGAKIDNQVHVGHNSIVEQGAVICGGTCLAGGAEVGAFAYVGGMVGITNRVKVGAGAKVGAMTLVTKDVEAGQTVIGVPQRSYSEHFKAHAILSRMVKKRGN